MIFSGSGFENWYKDNSLVENGLYDPLFGLVSFGGFVLEKFRLGVALLTDWLLFGIVRWTFFRS
jgi:hypothetical protein